MNLFYKCSQCKLPYLVHCGEPIKCKNCFCKERDELDIFVYIEELKVALRVSRVFIHYATYNASISSNGVELLSLIDELTNYGVMPTVRPEAP